MDATHRDLTIREALVMILNLPFGLVIGVAGVFLPESMLSVESTIGLITLFGIATRNGIMLISRRRHLQKVEGETELAMPFNTGPASVSLPF